MYPHLKLKVFADDITAFMEGRNKELPGIAEKVLRAMNMEHEEEGLKLSITHVSKEGKSKVIGLKRSFSNREGRGPATSVGTLGTDLRTRAKQLGAKEKNENEHV